MAEHAGRLLPHPAHDRAGIDGVHASVAIVSASARLRIVFRVEGAVGRIELPANAAARRADGLWQHTCFEAFLRADAEDAYHELNFSPGGAWAVYRFSGRRSGRESPEMTPPRLELSRGDRVLEMTASVALADLFAAGRAPAAHAGLAAVIEMKDGRHSYWALAHRAAQPDFHDPATFVLPVPAA